MSPGWLFAVGALVTLVVSIGLALPVYGAILDGRDEARREGADVLDLSTERAGHRPAA
jgi:hypothetical protein